VLRKTNSKESKLKEKVHKTEAAVLELEETNARGEVTKSSPQGRGGNSGPKWQ
jgi:hypothetical protein